MAALPDGRADAPPGFAGARHVVRPHGSAHPRSPGPVDSGRCGFQPARFARNLQGAWDSGGEIRASGGGSRSFLWRQIQADIYGKEVVTLRNLEGSALGAALLAGVASEVYSSVEESAREAIQVREQVLPHAGHARLYDRQYQVYRQLYPAVRKLSHQLAAVAETPS